MSEAEKHNIRFYEHNPWGLRNDNLIKAYTNDNVIDISHNSLRGRRGYSHKIKDA